MLLYLCTSVLAPLTLTPFGTVTSDSNEFPIVKHTGVWLGVRKIRSTPGRVKLLQVAL